MGRREQGYGVPPPEVWRATAADVCMLYGVTLHKLLYWERPARVYLARGEFWRRLRLLGYSLQGIGSITGHHHTTIMSALDKISERERWNT